MRYILLMLPFLLSTNQLRALLSPLLGAQDHAEILCAQKWRKLGAHDLVRPEVEKYNRLNPTEEPLVDPSSACIDLTLLILTWYHLFRQCDPPKDEDDLKELQELAEW
jgi:hypothetical protein